ncbi:MAG: hypothetical protein AB8F94_21730 [Saprospiraceae bacterium]
MNLAIRFLYILTFHIIFSISAYSQNSRHLPDFPSYESVVKHFYKNYKTFSSYGRDEIYFEKRPEGYFVTSSYNYPFDVREKRELFWSAKSKKIQKLKQYALNDNGSNSSKMERNHLTSYIKHEFDFCPFAGYPGWQREVIKIYGEKENLPDTLMYGLARAYSTLAANLVHDYSNNTDKEYKFNLPKGKNAMSKDQLKSFRKYAHLAQENFLKLHNQNSNFETIVGKVYTKYCSEVMWSFLLLQYFQNEEEARKELKPNLYNEFYLNAAKNYLNSCPPNAILFTYGDNDTYPLLYVQAQLGFRTDVMVANLSILALDRYIDHLRDGVFDAKAPPFPFDSEFYANDKNNLTMVLPNHGKDSYNDFNQVILDLKKEKNLQRSTDGQDISTILSPYFFLEIDKEKIIDKKIIPASMHSSIVDSLKWELPQRMVLKNDLAVIGIIAESNWNRPICMGATCRKENFLGMEDYFHLEGLAYRLYPIKKNQKTTYLIGGINVEECFNKITNDFIWDGIDKIESGEKSYFTSYLILFSQLSNQLIIQEKNQKAEQVLDLFIKSFPKEVVEYDNQFAIISDLYFQLDQNEKAEKIGFQVAENFSKINAPTQWDINSFYQLKRQAQKYQSQNLIQALEKIGW